MKSCVNLALSSKSVIIKTGGGKRLASECK